MTADILRMADYQPEIIIPCPACQGEAWVLVVDAPKPTELLAVRCSQCGKTINLGRMLHG